LTEAVGAPGALIASVLVVVAWLVTGPLFNFSDTWQLVISTVSSVVTFCMVFVIQASQNRDSRAIQLKLDEIIRSSEARNELINLETQPEERLEEAAEELLRAAGTTDDPGSPNGEHR
jgi:low affinity Fe/Cu permease